MRLSVRDAERAFGWHTLRRQAGLASALCKRIFIAEGLRA